MQHYGTIWTLGMQEGLERWGKGISQGGGKGLSIRYERLRKKREDAAPTGVWGGSSGRVRNTAEVIAVIAAALHFSSFVSA